MDFKFLASELRPLLSLAESLIDERSPVPATANILLDLADSTLTISSTDFRSTVIVSTTVDAKDPGSILVPGKTFARWVSRIDGPIRAHLDKTTLRLKSGNSSLSLKTMPASEYPALSFTNLIPLGNLDSATLIDILKKTAISADPSDALPARNAVALDSTDAIAADGVRLSRVAISPPINKTINPLLISRSALPDLWRSISGVGPLEISHDDRRLVLRAPNFLYAVQLTEATYIDWRVFFTNPITNKITVPTADLKAAVLRIADTNSDVPWVHFLVSTDTLTLDNHVIGNDSLSHGIESIAIETAELWELHVSLTYVRDILSVVTAPTIEIGLLPLGESNMIAFIETDSSTFVVAPMALGD